MFTSVDLIYFENIIFWPFKAGKNHKVAIILAIFQQISAIFSKFCLDTQKS